MTLLIPLLAFAFASLLVTAAALMFAPGVAATIERRLSEVTGAPAKAADVDPAYARAIVDALKRMGAVAPKSSSEMGKLQKTLVYAGYRSREALIVFFGIRLGVALACFALLASGLVIHVNLALALGGCGLGYLLSSMVLKRMAKRRQQLRLSYGQSVIGCPLCGYDRSKPMAAAR